MSRDLRPKKKRTPRQEWEYAQRAEKRAIAQAVRERPEYPERPGPPTWIDRRGPSHVRIADGHWVRSDHVASEPVRVRVPIKRGDH